MISCFSLKSPLICTTKSQMMSNSQNCQIDGLPHFSPSTNCKGKNCPPSISTNKHSRYACFSAKKLLRPRPRKPDQNFENGDKKWACPPSQFCDGVFFFADGCPPPSNNDHKISGFVGDTAIPFPFNWMLLDGGTTQDTNKSRCLHKNILNVNYLGC